MIDIHVDGSLYHGKSKKGGPAKIAAYGFLVYNGLEMVHFESGEINVQKWWLLVKHFETMAAEKAVKYVKANFPGHPFRVFTDSDTAVRDMNKQHGFVATRVSSEYSGYLFINNLRAHTLALGASRKAAREKNVAPPRNVSTLTFVERFKMWLPDYRRKAVVIDE